MAETRSTACPLDCPDACTLEVTVEDGRLASLTGTTRNAYTAGFICSKVRHVGRHVHGDERLLAPGIRSGPKGSGAFRPATWDEALDLVAAKLADARDRLGGEAILPLSYGGSNGLLSQDTADGLLFRRLGASRLARAVCAMPSGRAMTGLYGLVPGTALEDYEHARLIVVWGCNPSATGIHLVPVVKRARERGAKLAVVDPRRTPLAKQADLHLAPRPGTDLPVALAVLRELFVSGRADEAFLAEHCTGAAELRARAEPWTLEHAAAEADLDPADLRAFTELWARTSPAVVRCGWGIERNRNGGSAVAAVLALPAVAGKLGVRGGGFTLSNSKAWTGDVGPALDALAPAPATRTVNMNRLGRALLDERDPPVAVLYVYNNNGLATLPNQNAVRAGLAREDLFTVVHDQVATDTARWADVVLPATTFLEHEDLRRAYGSQVLVSVDPVLEPVGESRTNLEVFGALLERLGLAEAGDPRAPRAWRDALLDAGERGPELRAALDAEGIALPRTGSAPVLFRDLPPGTPDGKVHLVPAALDAEAPHGLYHYQEEPATGAHPLTLISPASERTITSTFGQLHREQVPLEMHPDDAAARDLADGASVRVFNDLGEVLCPLALTDRVRPGVVQLPKGLWSHHTANGSTANALCPDSLADLGGGACFNDARVEVEAAG